MSKHYVDAAGNYLGAFLAPAGSTHGIEPPLGGIEVPTAPPDGRCLWNGSAWGTLDLSVKDQRHEALKTAFAGTGAIERLRNATPAQIDTFIDGRWAPISAAITGSALSDGIKTALAAIIGEVVVGQKATAKAIAFLARGNED